MRGFRDFLNQGNVVQLAVAFVIGVAFSAVVTALVKNIVDPIIAIPFGKPNFDTLVLTINGSVIRKNTIEGRAPRSMAASSSDSSKPTSRDCTTTVT